MYAYTRTYIRNIHICVHINQESISNSAPHSHVSAHSHNVQRDRQSDVRDCTDTQRHGPAYLANLTTLASQSKKNLKASCTSARAAAQSRIGSQVAIPWIPWGRGTSLGDISVSKSAGDAIVAPSTVAVDTLAGGRGTWRGNVSGDTTLRGSNIRVVTLAGVMARARAPLPDFSYLGTTAETSTSASIARVIPDLWSLSLCLCLSFCRYV